MKCNELIFGVSSVDCVFVPPNLYKRDRPVAQWESTEFTGWRVDLGTSGNDSDSRGGSAVRA